MSATAKDYSKYLTIAIPNATSDSQYWIKWHTEVKRKYGKNVANELFMVAWTKFRNAKANDSSFKEYFKKYGFNFKADNTWEAITEGVGNIGDFIGDTFGSVRTIAMVSGGILFGIVAIALFNIAKNPAQAVGTAMSARTGGLK